MTPQTLLFILRLISAFLLLAFLGTLIWYLYRDLRAANSTADEQSTHWGILRVLSSVGPSLVEDTLIELAPVTTIGRNNRNSIVLDDTYVSGEHALISWRDSQWWLEDLGSRNGTYLNEVLITDPVIISLGDIIAIGSVKFKLDPIVRHTEDGAESGIRDSNP